MKRKRETRKQRVERKVRDALSIMLDQQADCCFKADLLRLPWEVRWPWVSVHQGLSGDEYNAVVLRVLRLIETLVAVDVARGRHGPG